MEVVSSGMGQVAFELVRGIGRIQTSRFASSRGSAAAIFLAVLGEMPRVPLLIAASVEYGIPRCLAVAGTPPLRSM